MFQFAHTEYLLLLILVPVFYILFMIGKTFGRKQIKRFGDPELLKRLMPEVSANRPVIKYWIYLFSLIFLILAIARPQFGTKLQEVKRKGIEIIIALDVSNSMMAEDIKPNRLERAKQAISKLVERLVNDRIGLIVFGGEAYTQIPITNDYASAKMFLSSINPGIVPVQGTAIGAAIKLATNSFTQEQGMNRAIIILTDGENHEDDPVAMASIAKEKGIKVYTIGVGLPNGAPIPVNSSSGQKSYLKDKNGQVVVSKLDEKMLEQIAGAGDGKYIRANNTRLGLNALFDDINKIQKKEINAKIYSEYNDVFQYPLGLAIFLLFIEFSILDRKNRKLKNIHFFGIKQ